MIPINPIHFPSHPKGVPSRPASCSSIVFKVQEGQDWTYHRCIWPSPVITTWASPLKGILVSDSHQIDQILCACSPPCMPPPHTLSLGEQKLDLLPHSGFLARLPQRRVRVTLLDIDRQGLQEHGVLETHHNTPRRMCSLPIECVVFRQSTERGRHSTPRHRTMQGCQGLQSTTPVQRHSTRLRADAFVYKHHAHAHAHAQITFAPAMRHLHQT